MKFVLALALLTFPVSTQAGVYNVSTVGVNMPGCGVTTPCASYSYLLYKGCDATGCADNIKPGDTVQFAPGVYKEQVNVTLKGTEKNPVWVTCSGNPGDCTISGAGLGLKPYDALVNLINANYLIFSKMRIANQPQSVYGLAISGDSHHIELRANTFDGTGSSENLIVTASRDLHDLTIDRNKITNCPGVSTGCTYLRGVRNLAIVNNEFGPVANTGNYDCNTVIGAQTALIDGNTCRDSADGFDQGMDSSGILLDRVITRYNRVYGTLTARAFPISGQYEGASSPNQFLTGKNTIYKNVVQTSGGSCVQPYGGAQDLLIGYNTCLNTGGYGSGVWLQSEYDYWIQRIYTRFNLFDTSGSNWNPPFILGSVAKTTKACPPEAPCPFVANGLWMGSMPSNALAVQWAPSNGGVGMISYYTYADWVGSWNKVPWNGANFRADPLFVNRAAYSDLKNVGLNSTSPYKDKADTMCWATSAGYGNAVPVTCGPPINDARYFFPSPETFYRLNDADCWAGGARAAYSPSGGCFSIQVQGCGPRKATSVQANVITINGPACSWVAGARVHVPWSGAAPDVGALEVQ